MYTQKISISAIFSLEKKTLNIISFFLRTQEQMLHWLFIVFYSNKKELLISIFSEPRVPPGLEHFYKDCAPNICLSYSFGSPTVSAPCCSVQYFLCSGLLLTQQQLS